MNTGNNQFSGGETPIELSGKFGSFTVQANLSNPCDCRRCGQSIYWATTRKGKSMPIEATGGEYESHIPNCSE